MATLIQSKDLAIVPRLIGLIGSQGNGKTTCAVTASEFYPGDCKDTVLLAFDLDATVGLQARGINLPTFQFSGINDWPTMQREIEDACKQITVMIKDKQVKNVIVDTVSLFDNVLLSYFAPISADNFALYARVAQWHRWFLMAQLMPLTTLGGRLIAIFQPNYKEIPDDKKKDEKAKATAKNVSEGLEPDADKTMAVSGKIAAKLYRTQPSLIAPVAKSKAPGGKNEYHLYPNGGGLGFEFKNRYGFLADKEEANLFKLYKKIEQHGATADKK
jgi:hypothetical protein